MSADRTIPRTQYAECEGLSIAYQVFGSGPRDLIVIPGIVSHVEADWDFREHAQARWKLAETFRVIVFDKRGQGLSDAIEGVPTLEERMDDVRAVMQAAGSHGGTVHRHLPRHGGAADLVRLNATGHVGTRLPLPT
jgi:pimeloyl-ACP methyl ester carboxylesterase